MNARTVVPAILSSLAVAVSVRPAGDGRGERTQEMVDACKARLVTITPALAENLDQLYTEDVRFRDPISESAGFRS